ncbi:MAG: ATP-binding protein [Acidobacteriota bacterium]|nr:ATP-binding protein [Acidobacteriota bacterium]
MTRRIFFKLLGAFLLVILAGTVTLDFAIRRAWETSLRGEIERALVEKTQLFAGRVQSDTSHSMQEVAAEAARQAQARATIIDSTGKVLADSEADPATMENHATRPEFAAALRGEVGSSVRLSHTVNTNLLYVAVPIPGGAVRLAYPLAAIEKTTAQVRSTLLQGSALALVVAMLIAGLAALSVSRRLNRIVKFAERVAAGDLSARIAESSLDEIGQVAAALDRTARRLEDAFHEVETRRQQMETLLNSMHEPVIAVSAERTVQWANGAMERLAAGRARPQAPVVEVVRDPDFLGALTAALEKREISTARVRSAVPGRIFDVTAAPMAGGAVAVLHDLTETERVEKTRRDFIANVSHELRTPLTSIQGYAETLHETLSDGGSARQFLEVIRKNTERMARLTEDLLTLARVESGEQKLEFASVPARQLLEDADSDLRETARSRGLELSVAESCDTAVHADPDAIHQVLANLIDNAGKYAAAGGRIELGARPAGEMVEFYVRDFGPGIASEHLSRLFERFYRVDKARSVEAGGTGLGLAIVKHIVLNHGGSVRAESELGHGTTFSFSLPVAAAHASSPAPS